MVDEVAVVVPVHDNLTTLADLHHRLRSAFPTPPTIVYVDDASTDGSWAWVAAAAAGDPTVHALRLLRNVGQTRAVAVGFDHLRRTRPEPSILATIDADLEYDPADLARLVARCTGPSTVAAGVRVDRRGSPLAKQGSSAIFNAAIGLLQGDQLGDVGCGCFALSADLWPPESGRELRRLAIRHSIAVDAVVRAPLPVEHRPRPGADAPMTTGRRARIALEVLAVTPRPTVLLAAASAAASVHRRTRPIGALLAAAAGVHAASHLRLRRSLTDRGAEVVEAVAPGAAAIVTPR